MSDWQDRYMNPWQDTIPAQPWGVDITAAQAPVPIGDRVVHSQPFRPFVVGIATPLPTGCAPAPLPGQTTVFDPQAALSTQGADVAALRAQVTALQAETDEMRGYVAQAHAHIDTLAQAMEKILQRLNALVGVTAGHVQSFATMAPVLNQLRADIDGLALVQRAGRRPV